MKKIGLSLGGGAVKGTSYIGLLQEFEDNNLKIHSLAASSVGALISTFYAAGYTPDEILHLAQQLSRRSIFGIRDFFTTYPGLFRARNLLKFIHKELGDIHFEDLKIPLKITGSDVKSAKRIVFDSGPIIPLLRMAISCPIYFKPTKLDNKIMYGGIATDLILTDLLRKDSDVTIASNVPCFDNHMHKHGFFRNIHNSIKLIVDELVLTKVHLQKPDVFIQPQLNHITNWSLKPDSINQCYKEGIKETRKHIPTIKKLISSSGNKSKAVKV